MANRRETIRRWLVRLIFVVYWILIFEGALRKWGLPQLNEVFFFLRVPVTLGLYWLAIKHKRWPRTSRLLLATYLLAIATLILVPIQFIAGGYDGRYLMLAGYGWVNYFFYIPLALLIADQFNAEDLRRLVRHTMWIAVLAAPVVVLQFNSPAQDVINLGSGLDEAHQFQSHQAALGFVRPTGFFTSALGQQMFVGSVTALVLYGWLVPYRTRPVSMILLAAGTIAVLVMIVFSGSRGLSFQVGLVFIAAVCAGLLTGRRRIIVRAVMWPVLGVGLTSVLWPLLFAEAYDVFTTRWMEAWESETAIFQYGIFGRAFYSFYALIDYLADTPLMGYLLGCRGNAVERLSWVQLPKAAYEWGGYGIWGREGGWAVHIIELGPLLGLGFIAFRIGLTIWLGWKVTKSTRHSGDVLPMLLFGFVGINLLIQQMTVHGTVNGYSWMFLGFCLAAVKVAQRTGHPALAQEQTRIGPQPPRRKTHGCRG